MQATVYIDGASRGNPGPAAFAFVIQADKLFLEENGRLGRATNNVAEYHALLHAMRKAAELNIRQLVINSDSELLVRQMNGDYRVKNPDLRVLYEEARQLARGFDSVEIHHIPRSQNQRADELCNIALDDPDHNAWPASTAKSAPVPTRSPAQNRLHEDAERCLRSAAKSWAKGDPGNPSPRQVWNQLWKVLQAHGLVE
jgi:ribonuclease HI